MIKAIEFFSGIGGLHYGLERAESEATVVASFDMNTAANACYAANFGLQPNPTSIQVLSLQDIERLKANCWLLSPPCQPFTQGGNKLDHEDSRSLPLLHLIEILSKTTTPPRFLFLENVPGFDTSECRRRLIDVLAAKGYSMEEFLVSPLELGIPYDRKRYYLSHRLNPMSMAQAHIPLTPTDQGLQDQGPRIQIFSTLNPDHLAVTKVEVQPTQETTRLDRYLEQRQDLDSFLVPSDLILKRKGFRFDLVKPTDTKCSCFTKGYGSKQLIGTGSLLQTARLDETFPIDDGAQVVASQPRFFTPTEIARLHGFPIDGPPPGAVHGLLFPDSIPVSQQFKLLGNSLSVDVVAHLLKRLFAE
eukprot:jgi/Hompol1/3925/HPOL_000722-RA